MSAADYGELYWCVKTPLAVSGDIYVHADGVEIHQGALVFMGRHGTPVLTIAAGQWLASYAASVLDGSAVAVEHWEGEVSR